MANIPANELQQTRTELEKAKSVLIVMKQNPTYDQTASALSFFLALSSVGKQVSIASASPMTVGYSNLVGIDKISTSINSQKGKNLILSFPYQEGSIEKVSYNIEGNTFNLVIEPRKDFPAVQSDSVKFSYGGGNFDAVVSIGNLNLQELGNLYQSNQSIFQTKPVINIDIQNHNAKFGKINIIDNSVSSVSELAVSLISSLGFTLNADIATNLLSGINSGSQNFTSSNTSASTFEAASICLKNGARKIQPQSDKPTGSLPQQPTSQQSPNQPTTGQPANIQQASFSTQQPNTQTTPFPQANQAKTPPSPNKSQQAQIPTPQIPKQQKPASSDNKHQAPPRGESSRHPETPPDWLKPKIYKGSTLL